MCWAAVLRGPQAASVVIQGPRGSASQISRAPRSLCTRGRTSRAPLSLTPRPLRAFSALQRAWGALHVR